MHSINLAIFLGMLRSINMEIRSCCLNLRSRQQVVNILLQMLALVEPHRTGSQKLNVLGVAVQETQKHD